jgi:hypothetical protein
MNGRFLSMLPRRDHDSPLGIAKVVSLHRAGEEVFSIDGLEETCCRRSVRVSDLALRGAETMSLCLYGELARLRDSS